MLEWRRERTFVSWMINVLIISEETSTSEVFIAICRCCGNFLTWGIPHNTPEKLENVALFPRLGLSSTRIRHKNGAFENAFQTAKEFKKAAQSRFQVN